MPVHLGRRADRDEAHGVFARPQTEGCAKHALRNAWPPVSIAPSPKPCAASSRFISAAPSAT